MPKLVTWMNNQVRYGVWPLLMSRTIMTANDWILPWFMLVRIMYIMLNMVGLFLSSCVPLFQ